MALGSFKMMLLKTLLTAQLLHLVFSASLFSNFNRHWFQRTDTQSTPEKTSEENPAPRFLFGKKSIIGVGRN